MYLLALRGVAWGRTNSVISSSLRAETVFSLPDLQLKYWFLARKIMCQFLPVSNNNSSDNPWRTEQVLWGSDIGYGSSIVSDYCK